MRFCAHIAMCGCLKNGNGNIAASYSDPMCLLHQSYHQDLLAYWIVIPRRRSLLQFPTFTKTAPQASLDRMRSNLTMTNLLRRMAALMIMITKVIKVWKWMMMFLYRMCTGVPCSGTKLVQMTRTLTVTLRKILLT